MDRAEAIDKVQKLWALADHPNTPDGERDSAAQMARNLMAKFQIEQITIAMATDKHEEVIMRDIRISEKGRKTLAHHQRVTLAHQIAVHNRCNAIVIDKEDTADVATGRRIPSGTFMTIVGFVSDCDMVQELFASIGYAMMMAMAEETVQTDNYLENFAAGFVDRIRVRLAEINREVHRMADSGEGGTGMALVLRSRETAVEDAVKRRFPNLKSYKVNVKTKFDPNAQERGARKANTVDVGATKLGTGEKGALGGGSNGGDRSGS